MQALLLTGPPTGVPSPAGDRKAEKNLDSITRQLTEEDLEALRAEMGEAN